MHAGYVCSLIGTYYTRLDNLEGTFPSLYLNSHRPFHKPRPRGRNHLICRRSTRTQPYARRPPPYPDRAGQHSEIRHPINTSWNGPESIQGGAHGPLYENRIHSGHANHNSELQAVREARSPHMQSTLATIVRFKGTLSTPYVHISPWPRTLIIRI